MKLFKCCSCGIENPATLENYFPTQIKHSQERPNASSLGKCSSCAKKYQADYSEKLKKKKLSRNRNPIGFKKKGTIYIIGPSENVNESVLPYKIGITVGTNIKKRLCALQTAHWMNLEIYYKSPLLEDVIKIEKYLHKKYLHKKVKGEWFNINENDISSIIKHCESI
jgi:hypothetical protein